MIWALHGAVGRSADWLGFAKAIKQMSGKDSPETAEVRRVDLWRFLDCCPMPLEEVGRAIASQIARIDPDPVLLGYSMGGRLALHALLADPLMWRGAVIVSAHPGLCDESDRMMRRQQDAEWSTLALKGEWVNFLQQWNAQGVLGGGGQMPDRMALKSRRASVARSFVDWSLGAQQDLLPRVGEIKCPVLWVTGDRDTKFTKLAESAVPRILDARHCVVHQCGHRVPWEKPDDFVELCYDFLHDLESGD